MIDEYDVFTEAEVEDRLIRSSEREERRLREALVFTVEVGDRAALRASTLPRDMRWWHGLWTRTYASRIG